MVPPVTDRAWLRSRLLRDPGLHLYELGDLDDFFWPHTTWYARGDAIVLVYAPGELPVVVGLGGAEHAAVLAELAPALPPRVYAHLSPGLVDALAPRYASAEHHALRKMLLRDPAACDGVDPSGVAVLAPAARDELIAFYARAYPGNWFDPRMLETRRYVGIRDGDDGALVAVAGVHVYSEHERVAALGNIAVVPEARGRGLARRVTAALCRSLRGRVDHVGLNVRADNAAAIACYTRLGFAAIATYEEHLLVHHTNGTSR
jgi:ribosomal protein S18 acetylase RimI-like enzyme